MSSDPRVNYEHYDYELRSAMRALAELPASTDIPRELATSLLHAWNCTWVIGRDYMQALWHAANKCKGPILECGSGLSTLILAVVANRRGLELYALEQKQWWAEHMQRQLVTHKLEAKLSHSPLQVRGKYSWYTPDVSTMPKFKLIICDGPPGGTKGGRYGLVPVMRDKFAKGCTLLLDDAGRPKEAAVLKQWERELGLKAEVICGKQKCYGVMKL